MSIERLRKSIQPPTTKPGPINWSEVSKQLGCDLPADYKSFAEEFGAGNLGDFIHIWRPFHPSANLDLIAQAKKHADGLRSMKYLKSPYPIYPQPDGLLPWGRTDNSDILMWLTKGAPDTWRVIITDSSEFHDTNVSTTDFLADFIEGVNKVPLFPDDAPTVKKFFPAG